MLLLQLLQLTAKPLVLLLLNFSTRPLQETHELHDAREEILARYDLGFAKEPLRNLNRLFCSLFRLLALHVLLVKLGKQGLCTSLGVCVLLSVDVGFGVLVEGLQSCPLLLLARCTATCCLEDML